MDESQGPHKFSSTQINLPPGLADQIIRWGEENIPDEDLAEDPDDPSFGREDEIHVTVLYGIHDDKPGPASTICKKHKPFEVELGAVSLFKTNEKYDVVKIGVESQPLRKLNKSLLDGLDATQTFPTYRPHVTVAYVKKGRGDALDGDKTFQGTKFSADSVLFSSRTREKTPMPLG